MTSPAQLLYAEYLAIQREHLDLWATKLLPALASEVEAYVLACNRPAEEDSLTNKPRVFRGQDLVEIILQWPHLDSCYPSRESLGAAQDKLLFTAEEDCV